MSYIAVGDLRDLNLAHKIEALELLGDDKAKSYRLVIEHKISNKINDIVKSKENDLISKGWIEALNWVLTLRASLDKEVREEKYKGGEVSEIVDTDNETT